MGFSARHRLSLEVWKCKLVSETHSHIPATSASVTVTSEPSVYTLPFVEFHSLENKWKPSLWEGKPEILGDLLGFPPSGKDLSASHLFRSQETLGGVGDKESGRDDSQQSGCCGASYCHGRLELS
jgi:hypothetical protein